MDHCPRYSWGIFIGEPGFVMSGTTTVLSATRRAMATHFQVLIPVDQPNATEAAHATLDLIDSLEAQLTVYREESEVSSLNRNAFERSLQVDPNLFHLLERSAWLTRETSGAFDIATGALIRTWGFLHRKGRMPTVLERKQALHSTGMKHVALVSDSQSVRYLREGIEINLGAIGKGYALDRCARLLREQFGIRSALLQGGSSSVLALDAPNEDRRGWQININHPTDPARQLGRIWLKNQAMGTSAATHQFFEFDGKKLGHILDPRIGYPATTMSQASVFASSAADADALSTAFFVMGREQAELYCYHHPEISALLLSDDAETCHNIGITLESVPERSPVAFEVEDASFFD
jgi:FAD:protein FMN transferase